jgi:hypothetical protein
MAQHYDTEHEKMEATPLEFVRERKASELVECDFLLPQPVFTGGDDDR